MGGGRPVYKRKTSSTSYLLKLFHPLTMVTTRTIYHVGHLTNVAMISWFTSVASNIYYRSWYDKVPAVECQHTYVRTHVPRSAPKRGYTPKLAKIPHSSYARPVNMTHLVRPREAAIFGRSFLAQLFVTLRAFFARSADLLNSYTPLGRSHTQVWGKEQSVSRLLPERFSTR